MDALPKPSHAMPKLDRTILSAMNEINVAFATSSSMDSKRLVHGFELKRRKDQIATVYRSMLAPGNDLEIAVAPDRFSDVHGASRIRPWLIGVRDSLGNSWHEHKPGSGWITIGLKLAQLPAFLHTIPAPRCDPRFIFPETSVRVNDSSITSVIEQWQPKPLDFIRQRDDETEQCFKTGQMYVSHFGMGNYLWMECLASSSIATFELATMRGFIEAGDREGYIAKSVETLKTSRGKDATPTTASRWFNVGRIIESTCGDIWLHTDGVDLWWTTSKADPISMRLGPAKYFGAQEGELVHEMFKPAQPWTRYDLQGRRLAWSSLHQKARQFLVPQGTMQKPAPENVAYLRALLHGESLDAWHDKEEWRQVVSDHDQQPADMGSTHEKEAMTMALRAMMTTKNANGQETAVTVKNKEFIFNSPAELADYVYALLRKQKSLCAISGIPLHFHCLDHTNAFLCSLDRIDSSKHYEKGNLQVVCQFINFWKGARDDAQFRMLLQVVCDTNNVRVAATQGDEQSPPISFLSSVSE